MQSPHMLIKIRFYTSALGLYALALVFALYSLGFVVLPNRNQKLNAVPSTLQNHAPTPPKPGLIITIGKPVKLFLPRIGLTLPITDGDYNEAKKTWDLSDNHAQYAVPSMPINDYSGNTLIYGHNYNWVFGRLKNLQAGDTLQITTDSGKVFSYIFADARELAPNDFSVFNTDGYPTVTLQTCSGRFNEHRKMYRFTLEEVES